MQGALFCAGLGDIIRTIYLSAGYRFISETVVPVPVIVASHNPFATEIFRFHRNARNFVLFDLAHKYVEFFESGLEGRHINRALCEFARMDYESLVRGSADGHVPRFDAPDDLAGTGHIVFQPFAGIAGIAGCRSLPEPLMGRIVEVLQRQPCPVYLITRSYIRKGRAGEVIHAEEDARRFAGGNITVLENLSVPASLNLIKRCRAYVGSWSSLQQAAWFEHKPVAVFYPPDYVDVRNRTDYAFGLDRADCHHADYPAADMAALAEWLRQRE